MLIMAMTLALTACNEKDNPGDASGGDDTSTVNTGKDSKNDKDDKNGDKPSYPSQKTEIPTPVIIEESESISALAPEQNKKEEDVADPKDITLTFYADGTYAFSKKNSFYNDNVTLRIECPEGAKVYYSMDGADPDENSDLYENALVFVRRGGDFPDAYTLRACMIDSEGNKSDVATRSFLVGRNLDTRFTTLVFFLSGDPAELTDEPDGILYGDNVFNRGRESERKVYIEAFEANGEQIFEQYGGVRVYGGYSRNATIKSLKIYARKSYDEDNKNFKIDAFNTPKLYEVEEGKSPVITKYSKLVLRNSGNDNQFNFIRDELSQRLCKLAGFDTYEEVLPVVVYLNGSYYSLLWLHESYCDKYFKEKFGDGEGEFIVAEGTDVEKSDDEEIQSFVDEYNAMYDRFSKADLTNDATFNSLCEYIDINSYLDFFAWNIALNNWDWPNNNFKCFRYVTAEGEQYGEGVFDGKWRYLPHDMDYTYGIYDQAKAKENYNTLKVVLDENNERYSPLFAKLMERKDCRNYFREKTFEYINGAQSEESIKSEYEKLHASRLEELLHYYDFMEIQNRKGYWDLWAKYSLYSGYEQQIYTFAEKRAGYVVKYMDALLPELE